MNNQVKTFSNKAKALLLAFCMILSVCFMVNSNSSIKAKADDGDITAIHITSNGDSGMNKSVSVTAGKTYTVKSYIKYISGDATNIYLGGKAVNEIGNIIINDVPQGNTKYDANGVVSYTFTAADTELVLYVRMGAGTVDFYVGEFEVYESDQNGNKVDGGETVDCDKSFSTWSIWYRSDCFEKVTVSADIFHRENIVETFPVIHQKEWGCFGINQEVAVEPSTTYTFKVLWRHIDGNSTYFQIYGDMFEGTYFNLAICKQIPNANVKYDADGWLTYTFTTTANTTTFGMDAQLGGGYNESYFGKPTLYKSDADGNPIDNTVVDCHPNFEDGTWNLWSGANDQYRIVETANADFFKRDVVKALKVVSNGESGINYTVNGLEAGKTYTLSFLWKYAHGVQPDFYVQGNAFASGRSLMVGDTAQQNVVCTNDGKIAYTFKSVGDTAELYVRMGTGVIEIITAEPKIYESDENGNPIENGAVLDCNPSFENWSIWYRGDCFIKQDMDREFFSRETLPYKYGDVNGDESLNIADLIRVKKVAAEESDDIVLEALNNYTNEINVTSSDVVTIKKMLMNTSYTESVEKKIQ